MHLNDSKLFITLIVIYEQLIRFFSLPIREGNAVACFAPPFAAREKVGVARVGFGTVLVSSERQHNGPFASLTTHVKFR